MTEAGTPPGQREFELTLLGPGYGESIALHVGDGVWVVVDSCLDEHGTPRALRYLESIGLDPARAVALIVATHWHDDHIRGMARLVEACDRAAYQGGVLLGVGRPADACRLSSSGKAARCGRSLPVRAEASRRLDSQ